MDIKLAEVIVWLIVGALAGSLTGFVVTRKKEGFGRYVNLGVYFNVGAALPVGPGEATFHLQLSGAGLKEFATPDDPDRPTITGKSHTTALAPTLGYRMVF